MTKPKKKDSLVWLEELVEAAKAWRATVRIGSGEEHPAHMVSLATAVDGYRQAIKDEVEAELDAEEKSAQ